MTRTINVEPAAKELGIGRRLAYEEVRRTGMLAGVPVIKVGRRLMLSRAAFERVLEGRGVSGEVEA